jgi:hypothetical protein
MQQISTTTSGPFSRLSKRVGDYMTILSRSSNYCCPHSESLFSFGLVSVDVEEGKQGISMGDLSELLGL